MKVTEILKLPLQVLDRVLLLGPPGIGKTEVVYERAFSEARRKDKIFIDLRKASVETLRDVLREPDKYFTYMRIIATHVFPEDVSMPRDRGDFIIFKSPLVLKILEKCEGVLFIDELTNLRRADQRVLFYALIQEKEIGWNLKLSDKITVIAAGNTPEQSSDAVELSKALENRMTIIECEPPSIEEWVQYMNMKYGDEWEKFCAIYLARYPADFYRMSDVPFKAFPSPRSWTRTAIQLYELREFGENIRYEFVKGNVGDDVATKFFTLMRVNIPEPREFLAKYRSYWESFTYDQKFLMIYSLTQFIQRNRDYLEKYGQFVADFIDTGERELVILLLRLTDKQTLSALVENEQISSALDKYIDELSEVLFT